MVERILTCAIHVVFVTMVTSTHFLCGMLQVGAWRVETAPHYRTHCEEPCPVKTMNGFVTPPNDGSPPSLLYPSGVCLCTHVHYRRGNIFLCLPPAKRLNRAVLSFKHTLTLQSTYMIKWLTYAS